MHGKIARVIEARFPSTKTTEPEMLAHHLTAAGLHRSGYSALAGCPASWLLKRMALVRGHRPFQPGARTGFHPPSVIAERDARELALRCPSAWNRMVGGQRRGQPRKSGHSLHPALALAKSLERHEALGAHFRDCSSPTFTTQGRTAESLPWAGGDAGHREGDRQCRPADHGTPACLRPATVRRASSPSPAKHADKVLDLYDEEKHRHLADILYRDPKTIAGISGSISTWMLGYPDRALRLNDRKRRARTPARSPRRPRICGIGAMSLCAFSAVTRGPAQREPKRCERLGRENEPARAVGAVGTRCYMV